MNYQKFNNYKEPMINQKTQSEKFSVLSIVIILIIIAMIVVYFSYNNQNNNQNREKTDINDRKNIQITEQKNFYGISGRILEIRKNAILITTPTLPQKGLNIEIDGKWIWTVFVDNLTEVFSIGFNEDGNPPALGEEEDEDAYLIKHKSTLRDLKVGDFVTVTSSNDIKSQFALDEKFMTAMIIEIY